jgi:hypothetical protein
VAVSPLSALSNTWFSKRVPSTASVRCKNAGNVWLESPALLFTMSVLWSTDDVWKSYRGKKF